MLLECMMCHCVCVCVCVCVCCQVSRSCLKLCRILLQEVSGRSWCVLRQLVTVSRSIWQHLCRPGACSGGGVEVAEASSDIYCGREGSALQLHPSTKEWLLCVNLSIVKIHEIFHEVCLIIIMMFSRLVWCTVCLSSDLATTPHAGAVWMWSV